MRVNLVCPYDEREAVKRLGARWDPERRCWYVIDPDNLGKFMRWLPKTGAPVAKPGKKSKRPKKSAQWIDKPRVTIAPPVESCSCNALPWEDCEHTAPMADEAQQHMREIAA